MSLSKITYEPGYEDGVAWHLRFPAPLVSAICGDFGSWRSAEAAASAATGCWEGAVPILGSAPHDWKKCKCGICRGQREAHVYLTTPCPFSP